MQGNSGIWIDHKEAFIVFAGTKEAPPAELGVDQHVKFSGHDRGHEGSDDDKHGRRRENEFVKFYDEVITHVSDAESILLFGPGEAKGELEKRLGEKGLAKRIVGVETVDTMTDKQIVAKVREHYEK